MMKLITDWQLGTIGIGFEYPEANVRVAVRIPDEVNMIDLKRAIEMLIEATKAPEEKVFKPARGYRRLAGKELTLDDYFVVRDYFKNKNRCSDDDWDHGMHYRDN